MVWHVALYFGFLVFLTSVAVSDWRTRKIPNIFNLGGIILGVTFALGGVMILPAQSPFISSVLGVLVGFLVLLPVYVVGGMGAGDVKFTAAVGAFLGWKGILLVVAGAHILALVVIVLMWLMRFKVPKTIPFGVPLAIAAMLGSIILLYV